MIINFNTNKNVIKTADGYYHFVNHKEKLLTVGFRRKKTLLSYADCFRDDIGTRELMRKRYIEFKHENWVREIKSLKGIGKEHTTYVYDSDRGKIKGD